MTLEETEPLKRTCDTLADRCLEALDRISPPPTPALPRNRDRVPEKLPERQPEQEKAAEESVAGNEQQSKRDLYFLLKENKDKDEDLRKMWDEVNTVPEWVDWEQIQRGQDTFYRYGAAAITGLAFQSLLGGMGAARVTETLARTGGFSPKVARGRLFETTQVCCEKSCCRSCSSSSCNMITSPFLEWMF
jgi:hypothetical protein